MVAAEVTRRRLGALARKSASPALRDRRLRGLGISRHALSNQFFDDVSIYVGQTKIPAGVTKGQLRVVETKKLKHRRVQVVNVNRVFHRFEAELVRGTVHIAAADSASRQPHRKAVVIMVA